MFRLAARSGRGQPGCRRSVRYAAVRDIRPVFATTPDVFLAVVVGVTVLVSRQWLPGSVPRTVFCGFERYRHAASAGVSWPPRFRALAAKLSSHGVPKAIARGPSVRLKLVSDWCPLASAWRSPRDTARDRCRCPLPKRAVGRRSSRTADLLVAEFANHFVDPGAAGDHDGPVPPGRFIESS